MLVKDRRQLDAEWQKIEAPREYLELFNLFKHVFKCFRKKLLTHSDLSKRLIDSFNFYPVKFSYKYRLSL